MTPTELLEMLKGWPVEARPVNHWATVVGTQQHAGVDSMHIDHAVDLACMAGLRWLAKGAHSVTWGNGAGGVWLTGLGGKLGRIDVMEPTILHAIDAAIRASK